MPLETILKHAELTERIIGVYYEVYRVLGHGFLASVYEEAFALALNERGLGFQRQQALEVWFRGRQVGAFRADFTIEARVLAELKAVKVLTGTHEGQLLNYLAATDFEVGLLFNFGMRPRFLRRVFENQRKTYRGQRGARGRRGSETDVCCPPVRSACSACSAVGSGGFSQTAGPMERTFATLGALSAFIAVAAGAFGAHALRGRLAPDMLAVFETGARYQMYHALGLIAVAWLAGRVPGPMVTWAGWLFVIGTLLFSGSLYALALSGIRQLGAITPLGGLAFLAGWACLALAARRL